MSELAGVHPDYTKYEDNWKTLRDFYDGSDKVKEAGTRYLPATEGMMIDGMNSGEYGFQCYQAYKQRARVPDYVYQAIETLVGLMHQKDAIIELPPQMEYLREKASATGEPLTALHRRINVEQLTTGRLGLLVDLPAVVDQTKPQPYMALYPAESIRNWDNREHSDNHGELNMVVLDESGPVRKNTFSWEEETRYRVLVLGSAEGDDATGKYRQAVFKQPALAYDETALKAPSLRGKEFEHIPFVFINTKDLLSAPDVPPLKGLAEACKGIYQSEADYRQNLYMQSQETLVVKGGTRSNVDRAGATGPVRVGAGARIDVDDKGDAKYIGVSAAGLSEQRQALTTDREAAKVKAGQLVQNNGSQMESGSALTTRFNAQTATLNQIAQTGAAGLAKALRFIAEWLGADPSKVKVTPNTEYVNFNLDGQNFVQLMTARQMGLPISLESLHAVLADRGMTVMDLTRELEIIRKENVELKDLLPSAAAPGTPGSGGAPGAAKPTNPQNEPPQE
jgi:hypothetical protein